MRYISLILLFFIFFSYSCNENKNEPSEDNEKTIAVNNHQPQTDQIMVYYENGTPKFVENIMSGKKHGEYMSYYKNGQKKVEGTYKEGKRTGVWKFWDEKGEISYQIDYSSDLSLRF
ncbi:MAG: hypothetical protein Kow0068_22420 [Marinilabiliales bacterium]